MTCCIGMDFFPTNFMLQTPHHLEDDHHQPSSRFPSSTPLQNFYGSFLGKRSCEEAVSHGDNGLVSDEEDEEGSIEDQKIKKRRLNREQVKALEKSFEAGNKLEPERKTELARALGLEPRQIAIWFQNRRARWKTKQLERAYESLKNQFDSLKAENDALLSHNQNLHVQIMALKNSKDSIQPTESINLNKETEGSCSNSSEIKLDISRSTPAIDSHPTTRSSLFTPPTMRPAAGMAHLLHSSSSRPSDLVHYQCLKMGPTAKEETLSNMFCGNDDQSGFWPWLDQQHFN